MTRLPQLFALQESQCPFGLAGPLKMLQLPQAAPPPLPGVKKPQAAQIFCASVEASV